MRKLVAVLIAALVAASLAASATAGAPPVKKAKIDVTNYEYLPGTLRIKHGTKVVWTWVDGHSVRHDIHVKSGPAKFHSRLQSRGTYSHLFTKPGKYVLYCTIHPAVMHETVIVK